MKKFNLFISCLVIVGFILGSCSGGGQVSNDAVSADAGVGAGNPANMGQAGVVEDSDANIFKIAVSSPDHTVLVAAVQAAGIEHVLANPGPLTLFAPTNDAFAALPDGTVDNLLKPENKSTLINILYYHAAPGTYKGDLLNDGRQIYEANGDNVEIKVADDGSVTVNGANIIGTVEASNGVIHIIDAVLLPPEK